MYHEFVLFTDSGPLRPEDIKVRNPDTNPCCGGFGKHEVEASAGKLIQFFQFRGHWGSFSMTELYNFYQLKGWDVDEILFGLAGAWFDDGPGVWRNASYIGHFGTEMVVDKEFIRRCQQ